MRKLILFVFISLTTANHIISQRSFDTKNMEFFIGFNATSSFGNVVSTDNSIFLDPETTNFNFDRMFPSFKFGYKYYVNPKQRVGFFVQYKANSKKFIRLKSDVDSDYQFLFEDNFNEIQIGVTAGPFDFSYGKLLDKMLVNGNEIDFKTASINLSLIQTDGYPRGQRSYINLYTGVNLISDFDDLSYLNLLIGLNYHFRFNKTKN